jgi:polygalacturonase
MVYQAMRNKFSRRQVLGATGIVITMGLIPTVEFNRCDNVLIEGVTIKNAAFWSVHPVLSNNVTARGVIIDTPVVTMTEQQKHIPVIRNISFSNISC